MKRSLLIAAALLSIEGLMLALPEQGTCACINLAMI